MSDIVRYGTGGGTGTGGQHLPFARAVAADGWLFVSGQVPMLVYQVIAQSPDPEAPKELPALVAGVQDLLARNNLILRPKESDRTLDLDAEIAELLLKAVPVWRRAGAL